MASRFYAIDVGANTVSQVVEGAATGSKAVEIQVDLAKTTDRLEVIKLLQILKQYLISRETTPIA